MNMVASRRTRFAFLELHRGIGPSPPPTSAQFTRNFDRSESAHTLKAHSTQAGVGRNTVIGPR